MAPIAPTAVLCGDPARALTIAQELLVEARMSNHHRGLWGYHGETKAGLELTVQATGVGGPTAALVISELGRRGTVRAIRVGSSRCLDPEPESPQDGSHRRLGATVAARAVIADDGASAAYGARPSQALAPDPDLTRGLVEPCEGCAPLHSVGRLDPPPGSLPAGALYDLQSAALLAAATEAGVRLAIATVLARSGARPLQDEPLEAASVRLAKAAAELLADESRGSDGPSNPRA